MASCSSLLPEEQVLCSICLEVFNEPSSIPCGHNFCKVCISNYWDTTDLCQCPLCKDTFYRRPELRVNTTLRDLVEHVKKTKVRDEDESGPGLSCDVCTGTKLKALKSCLVCQTSYCETHLEPHLRVAALKKHKLIRPVENLEDRCKKHDRLLEFFCKREWVCVCLMCMNTDHKTHNIVPLEQEYGERKAQLGKLMAYINQTMKTRHMKIQEIQLSVETSKKNTEREILASVEFFTALVNSIQKSQDELIQLIEEKQKATEKQAEGFIRDLEQEITDLKRRSSELEPFSHSEDHFHLLQTFPSILNTRPLTKDWSQIKVQSHPVVETVRVVSQLEEVLNTEMEKLAAVKLKRIQQQYAVSVTLDPGTAHPNLILSKDGKQVRHGDIWKHLPDNPERFDRCPNVLGKPSFCSGRFYYEVQVKGKTVWYLGVARESINRKGQLSLSPTNGFWTILLTNGNEYMAAADTRVLLSLREKPHKVGVFVDYEEGQVSFYNVKAKSHIYSFTGYTFTEKLFPFLSPWLNDDHENSAPLIITAVTHTA